MDTIASRLRQLRGLRNRHEFAALLGCSHSTLVRYESGERKPKFAFLQNVADKTGADLEWLVGEENGLVTALGKGEKTMSAKKKKRDFSESCIRCSSLEKKIGLMEEERREISAENRRLHGELEKLLRESADLREKLARLEAIKSRLSVAETPVENSGAA